MTKKLSKLNIKIQFFFDTRELFYDETSKTIMLNLRYHKNQSKQRENKKNLRFLNKNVSNILILYLIFVQSFYEYLNLQYLNHDKYSSIHLFEVNNKIITLTQLSNFLKLKTSQLISISLRLLMTQYVILYIIRERRQLININDDENSNSNDDDFIEYQQANHNKNTTFRYYNRD